MKIAVYTALARHCLGTIATTIGGGAVATPYTGEAWRRQGLEQMLGRRRPSEAWGDFLARLAESFSDRVLVVPDGESPEPGLEEREDETSGNSSPAPGLDPPSKGRPSSTAAPTK